MIHIIINIFPHTGKVVVAVSQLLIMGLDAMGYKLVHKD